MKSFLRVFILLFVLTTSSSVSRAQSIKTNLPLLVVGTPNIGAEFTLSQQFTINGDLLWAPYLFKNGEQVFRALVGSADLRYYLKPKFYYTNDLFDGFYVGPYVMMGNFNVGLKRNNDLEASYRYRGWGVSSGVSLGYKFYLSKRFRLDVNLGLGVAHLQYDRYALGGEWSEYPLNVKDTKLWVGPTKFGVHLVYNLFR